jgi:hypothetical protein
MIYLMLYLANTLVVIVVTGRDLTFALMLATFITTLPGWVAVWYSSRKPKGSLS